MDIKKCSGCFEIKDIQYFYKKRKKDNTFSYVSKCINCLKIKAKEYRDKTKTNSDKVEYFKNYYKNNKETLKEYKREYRLKNSDKLKENRKEYYKNNYEQIYEKSKIYKYINRDKINEWNREYNKNKRDSEPLFRLKNNIRTYIYTSLKNKDYRKESKTFEIVGLPYHDFIIYIESKFESWMNWENYGRYNGELNYGWDIDHIIPISSASDENDIYRLNNYKNLQPLCSKINRDIKRDKII